MKKLEDLKITIVGLGMEGGSYAIALRHYINPKKLWGVDIDENSLIAAGKLGVIDKGFLNPIEPLKNSDLVIMCIYPSGIIDFIEENNLNFKSNCIITDVAGVKERLVNEINSFIRDDLDYIAGHPMAGNEYKGFLYASKDIFNGANYLITPSSKNKEENLKLIENIAYKIGCSNVMRIDYITHDIMIAYASQLIHVIATSIVNNEHFSDDITLFSGGSFKNATRVANINSDLWTDAFIENKKYLIEELEKFEKNISLVKNSLENNDREALYNFLQKSYLKRNNNRKVFQN